MRLLRRQGIPEVVRAVALPAGERRVAWALTPAGEPVVAGTHSLHLPTGPVLGWAQIERASWLRPRLTVVELTERVGSGRVHEVTLDLERETTLPETVRARVSASVAWTAHLRLQPTGGVRVVAHRGPGGDQLDWQLVFDRDTDPADPELRAQALAHLEAARRTVG